MVNGKCEEVVPSFIFWFAQTSLDFIKFKWYDCVNDRITECLYNCFNKIVKGPYLTPVNRGGVLFY